MAKIIKKYGGASDRNKDPILNVLKQFIKQEKPTDKYTCLEISSGAGVHVSHFAPHFPFITFQPTEFERGQFQIIDSLASDCSNVLPAKFLDASQHFSLWINGEAKPNSFDFIININMIHISEWAATEGLFKGCRALLKPEGLLFTYGPYADNGVITPESNIVFDNMLKSENPGWGLRDISRELVPLAKSNFFNLINSTDCPANNKVLVWKKVAQ